MKLAFTLIVFFFSWQMTAQKMISTIKFDSLEYNDDSTYLLLYKKRKTALYDVHSNLLLVKPTRYPIIPIYERDIYCVFNKVTFSVYDFQNKETVLESDYLSDTMSFSINALDDQHYLIQNYCLSFDVHKKRDTSFINQYKYQKSGVFNTKVEKWEVPNVYGEIIEYEDYLFCAKYNKTPHFENDQLDPNLKLNYDIYEKTINGWEVLAQNVQNNEMLIKSIYTMDKIRPISSNYFILQFDSGQGLLYFNFFDKSMRSQGFKYYDWIIEPNQKFIHLSHDKLFIGVLSKNNTLLLYKKDDNPAKYNLMALGKEIIAFNLMEDDFWVKIQDGKTEKLLDNRDQFSGIREFGLVLYEDSLLKIIDYQIGEVLLKTNEFGEPTYDELTGEPLFYEHVDLRQSTGVINLKSLKWVIEPIYLSAFKVADGFVFSKATGIQTPTFGVLHIEEEFRILTKKEILEQNLTRNQIWHNQEVLQLLVKGDQKAVFFDGPNDLRMGYKKNYNSPLLYSLNKKMGLIEPLNSRVKLADVKTLADFIHMNTTIGYSCRLENGNWTICFDDTTVVLSEDKSWELVVYNINIEECLTATIYIDDDSLEFYRRGRNKCKNIDGIARLSVLQKDSIIVLKDQYRYDYMMTDLWGEIHLNGSEEQESSAIWKNTGSGWNKISPYYAEIIPMKKGFIARTGEYSGEMILDDVEGWGKIDENGNIVVKNSKDSRYIYLDSNAYPVSFMDYFDFPLIKDLGFGISMCTDKGCFFVTYDGIALTNDEWDHFELEDNRLKAFSDGVLKDQQGNPLYNEWGEIIYAKEPIVMYFDLSK